MKPQTKTNLNWTSNIAYAVGLIVTDGHISKDGRHIDLTSKDKEQLENFMKCLGIKVKIGFKQSGYTEKKYPRIQFSHVNFYRFLSNIGVTNVKTKSIIEVKVPDKYFFDFLRGHLDGDGTFYSYWDPRWHSSFMFYTVFLSASKKHIEWLQNKIFKLLNINGAVSKKRNDSTYTLRYAKKESLKLLPKIYYSNNIICLSRKFKKIHKALAINKQHNK